MWGKPSPVQWSAGRPGRSWHVGRRLQSADSALARLGTFLPPVWALPRHTAMLPLQRTPSTRPGGGLSLRSLLSPLSTRGRGPGPGEGSRAQVFLGTLGSSLSNLGPALLVTDLGLWAGRVWRSSRAISVQLRKHSSPPTTFWDMHGPRIPTLDAQMSLLVPAGDQRVSITD